jgi:hypothetical protein
MSFGIFTGDTGSYIIPCLFSISRELALEKPLTNCDAFPDNNDPNDLSVLICKHQRALYGIKCVLRIF